MIGQGQISNKKKPLFDILQECVDYSTTIANIGPDFTVLSHDARGLSKLSDIESSFQVSKNNLAQTVQALNNTHMMSVDDRLHKQKEESDAVISGLHRTIRDMAHEIQRLESLNEQDTPNLSGKKMHENKMSFSALPNLHEATSNL